VSVTQPVEKLGWTHHFSLAVASRQRFCAIFFRYRSI